MTTGQFDTDSAALAQRLELQHRLSEFDLNAWIFDRLEAEPGHHCLDIGCGRGEQSLPLAERVGPSGSVTSADLSRASLDALEAEAKALGLDGRIRTIHTSHDDLAADHSGGPYDRIVSSYALYYVQDAEPLLASIRSLLAPGGRFLFCGPVHENNLALRKLVVAAGGDPQVLEPTRSSTFMVDTAPAICRQLFGTVEIARFENPVRFREPEEAIQYWRSHNLYDARLESAFAAAVEEAFAGGEFVNVKHGMAVIARP